MTTENTPQEAPAAATKVVDPAVHYCPCNKDLDRSRISPKFIYYASQQSAVMEWLTVLRESNFTDDIKEEIARRILVHMLNLSNAHTTFSPEHQAELKELMETINREVSFANDEQQETKAEIMKTLNLV